jgi:putative ATPase
LAERMRPRTVEEFEGAERLLGPTALLQPAIRSGEIPSIVFWGPRGCG